MTEPEKPHIIAGGNAILARRYAHALFELAEEKNQLDAVADDLRTFRELVKGNADFYRLVHNPRLTRVQLATAMGQLAFAAKLGSLASSFFALLAHKRRLDHLKDIIGAFLNMLAEERGEHVVEIQAARELTAEQRETLRAKLEKQTGGRVRLIVSEDPGLLGGLIMKWGSRLLDASLKGKLAQIERQLKAQNQKEAA